MHGIVTCTFLKIGIDSAAHETTVRTMNRVQFFILIGGALLIYAVSFLQNYFSQITATQNSLAANSREIVARGPVVKERLQHLIASLQEAGRQDGAIKQILINRQIDLADTSEGATSTDSVPPASNP
jgi:hypothetical protein